MKKFFFKLTAIILALTCLYSFCGCDKKQQKSKNSIVIAQEENHSKQTEAYAESVILSILKYAVQKEMGVTPSDAVVKKLTERAKDVQSIIASTPIHEDVYRTFMSRVKVHGNKVIDVALDYDESDFSTIKEVYLDLTSVVGSDYLGGVLYDLCAYTYQYKYEQAILDYEEYGYSFLLLDAKRYQSELNVLKNEVGKNNFITAIKNTFAFADLFLSKGAQSQQLSAFTDTEILLFIKSLDVSSLTITDAGWELLLSYAIPSDSDNYLLKLLSLMKEHDLTEGAKALNVGVKLVSNSIDRWTEEDAYLLRQGDFHALIKASFARFDDDDWKLFESATTCEFESEDYEALAMETYGDAYVQYKQNLTVFTLSDLKTAVNEENFYEILRGYVAGISPAFSYGMKND